jgi:hypothetical protein
MAERQVPSLQTALCSVPARRGPLTYYKPEGKVPAAEPWRMVSDPKSLQVRVS